MKVQIQPFTNILILYIRDSLFLWCLRSFYDSCLNVFGRSVLLTYGLYAYCFFAGWGKFTVGVTTWMLRLVTKDKCMRMEIKTFFFQVSGYRVMNTLVFTYLRKSEYENCILLTCAAHISSWKKIWNLLWRLLMPVGG